MTNQITAVSHTVAVEEKADWELSDVIALFRFLLNKEMPSMRLPRASLLRREQQNGTHYFSFRDHLGSVRELVNGRGCVVTEITYEPYGVMTVSGSVEPSVGFAGMYWHQSSSLNLTWYRAYDHQAVISNRSKRMIGIVGQNEGGKFIVVA